jgi:hypothetical protein
MLHMILDVRRKIQELPIKVTGCHIQGHQDNRVSFRCLDRWAKLNVQMVAGAKNLLRKHIAQGFFFQPAPLRNATLQIYFWGNKLSQVKKQDLYETSYGEKLLKVWQKRHHLTQSHVDHIDWESTSF